jgi:hypothetical protein
MSSDMFDHITENGIKNSITDYTCKSCRYYHTLHDSRAWGECYYYPPVNIVVQNSPRTIRPTVLDNTYVCGMFARKFDDHVEYTTSNK